ncbi:MAG: aminoacyl-tRNA hydrolase [Gammaproteobacteria bacterium]
MSSSQLKSLRLVVGLGNPGAEYRETRHNVGAWFVDQLASVYRVDLRLSPKLFSLLGSLTLQEKQNKLHLMIPSDYMNLSGKAVQAVVNFYKISLDEILIAHDDLDFSPGIVRLKFGGGHGGHNGLRDIIKALGSGDFYRLRLGIGHPKDRGLVADYVLSKPSRSDKVLIIDAIDRAVSVFPDMVSGNWDKATRNLHQEE